jgi:hypothetical protein
MIYIDYFLYGLAALCVLGAPAILLLPYAVLMFLVFKQVLTVALMWTKVKIGRNSDG